MAVKTELSKKPLAAFSSEGVILLMLLSSVMAFSTALPHESLLAVNWTPNKPESEKVELTALALCT